ncbi:MAG TPA: N(4)-(beta-N-acetylglucosaminyl)-L-asparaginase [Balneolaceae bacterium]|nr:N(4)-(beta-N-acetylglucosaminyl)-L-asparaginase [Balneolaceae bacterium]
MSSRRKFIKQSIVTSALLLPAGVRSGFQTVIKKNEKKGAGSVPVILSTWNHGIAANDKAWQVLHQTGNILDAVEEGVKVTEADLNSRSVGLNGHPDREGIVTLDASIMNKDGDCGSVCFVRQIKHPIMLARKVMEHTPHVMLAGEGAKQFAISEGFPIEIEELNPDAAREFEAWKDSSEYKPIINIENHDTIGMVGVDADGNLSGSCTTSGLAYKMHGRVGDSPIIGAGLYVDNEVGAATATGMGESIIRICGSFLAVELMRQGRSPAEACEEVVRRLVKKNSADINDIQAAFIAVNKDGEYGSYAVQPQFNYAVRDSQSNRLVDSESYF